MKNTGTIRDNFEDYDEVDEVVQQVPGPGGYLKSYHANLFGQTNIVHKHPQNFGIVDTRFKDKKDQSPLGPGQYLSQNKVQKYHEKYLPKLSANFAYNGRSVDL